MREALPDQNRDAGRKGRAKRTSLRSIHDALHRLYEVTDLAEFPAVSMSVTRELVPAAVLGFGSVDQQSGEETNVFDRATPLGDEEFMRRWHALCHEHPMIRFVEQGGMAPVMALTDFLTERELRRTALYQEVFKAIGGGHQLAMILPVPGQVVGLAVNRDRAFTEKERGLVEMLHPHCLRAFRNAQLFTTLRRAREVDYTPWRRRGFTLRECEVLRWMMEGKRNGEIAVILGARPHTIARHVENILAKLCVENRASAGAEARRLLGG